MKHYLALLAILAPAISHAADDVAATRARTAAVDKAAPKATIIKRELQGYSLEGGELTAYFQEGVPLKFVAKHYGESGKTTDELYFWQGRLFFVLSTRENYNHPIGGFDTPVKVASREQNRYYFKNGRLWRWVNQDGKTIESGTEFNVEQNYQLQFAREMLGGARAKSRTIEAPKGSGMN